MTSAKAPLQNPQRTRKVRNPVCKSPAFDIDDAAVIQRQPGLRVVRAGHALA
jgi:hypothetical protein